MNDPTGQDSLTGLTSPEVAEALAFAQQAIQGAGEIARRYFRQPLEVDNKLAEGRFDPVTRADREVEAFLREELGRRFPDFGIVGEEGGTTPGRSNVDWVIDPIDGTKAFISGFPTWGILVGLQQGDRALAGLMHQPVTGELFYGSAAGAFLQLKGQTVAMQAGQTTRLEEALLYCTHESMFANDSNLAAFRRVAAQARLQRFGGDCYAYCMLALGQIDLVVEDTLQPYDIVPLIPIIEAAGGVVTDARGKSPVAGGFVVAAANRQLHEQVMALL
ncbi:MAG: inositol monophosphatase family protein [Desulfuromonadales bacterium]|nr:inositol monophosphatase family protein [Desulfuromonadales bacterium]